MLQRLKNIFGAKTIGAFLGTIIEYYDYSLYGFSAGVIATKFFATNDYLYNLSQAFAVYAVAYVSKPIGSIIFGRIGDLYGRKVSLNITIIGIAVPTFIIGLLPEYADIGYISTITLISCRFLQGVFVAGEYDGAAIYVIEHTNRDYHFTASALTRVMGVIGLLLGIAPTNFFSSHIFNSEAWRIPFILSLPLSFVALYYRNKLTETPDFENSKSELINIYSTINLIKTQWRNLLVVLLFAGSCSVTYQIAIIFMRQYLPIVLPQSQIIISTFSIICVILFGISMLGSGFIADYTNPIIVLKISGIGTIISATLLALGINYNMLNLSLASSLMLAVFVAPFNGLAHGIIIKLFHTSQRYRCISIGHTVGSMLISSTANYICLVFMNNWHYNLFPVFYLIFFTIILYCVIILFLAE